MRKFRKTSEGVAFRCPGCMEMHAVPVKTTPGSKGWTFNGDYQRPTLMPSLNIRTGHFVDPKSPCYCADKEVDLKCSICHSFVKEGHIQFLADCTHHLAGKTVPLDDIVEEV